jgi:hypothetical protein
MFGATGTWTAHTHQSPEEDMNMNQGPPNYALFGSILIFHPKSIRWHWLVTDSPGSDLGLLLSMPFLRQFDAQIYRKQQQVKEGQPTPRTRTRVTHSLTFEGELALSRLIVAAGQRATANSYHDPAKCAMTASCARRYVCSGD